MTITRRKAVQFAAFALASPTATSRAYADGPLRVGGTGSATELFAVLDRDWRPFPQAVPLAVVPALGSSGGIQAVRDGALDLAITARPIKPGEADALVAIPFARSPYVFATSHASPPAVTLAELAALYADPQAKWPGGTPVRVILRPRSESDTGLIERSFPPVGKAIDEARKRSEIPIAVTDIDNASMAEKTPGSLAGISLMQVTLEKRQLKPLTIDGRAPSLASFSDGSYPYGRDFFLVHPKTPSPAVQSLTAFLRSSDGVALLRRGDCLPIA